MLYSLRRTTVATLTCAAEILKRYDEVIDGEIHHFKALGQDFEWKVYAHDQPPDLLKRLRAMGFITEEPEALMVLDLQAKPSIDRQFDRDVRRITTSAAMQDVVAVQNQVWREDHAWMGERLARLLRTHPDYICVYAAYNEGKPVSCGWIDFPAGTEFAGIWGGCTLAGFRRQGFYTALVAARLREALERRFPYVTVDARPTSRPILEKLGFKIIGWSQEAKWHHRREADGGN